MSRKHILIGGASIIILTSLGLFMFQISHQKMTARTTDSLTISGITIPHHDLVKQQRQDFLDKVAGQIKQPSTIILVSPNHYETGIGDAQVSDQTWHVSAGDIKPNKDVITALTGKVTVEPGSFSNEHGIKLVLADLKQNFPAAQIVPIILKRSVSVEQLGEINDALISSCKSCLLVGSVDFSHYQPALLANLHDDTTIRGLQNLDANSLLKTGEVDSPGALALLTKWADAHQTKQFHLDNHTNSGVIAKDPDQETTSHVFGWYQSGNQATPPDSVSFTIGGDMMFGRSIAHTFLKDGLQKSLDQLGERIFWGTDAGIVNLEGPVSPVPVKDDTRSNNLTFNFPPQTIAALRFLKVNIASQANNHSANAGQAGLKNTRAVLTAANIQPLGGPNDIDVSRVASVTGQNLKLYIIGVHELASQPNLTKQIQDIKKDPTARVLVFPHWGAEYVTSHIPIQAEQAHAWIDAGADIVIGAHPHVIEDTELYKGKPIIYSLGNLLFDQAFSTNTQQGLIISGKFTKDGLYLFGLPVQSIKYKPRLMRGDDKKSILDKVYAPFTTNKQVSDTGTILFFPTPSK